MANTPTIWQKPPCKWTYDDDGGTWTTACGELFAFTEEGPVENKFHFCCYCGGELIPCRKPDCEVCGGRGWDAEDNTCGACDGTGKDDEPRPIAGVQPSDDANGAAVATLMALGYTFHGGEFWQPPSGTPPLGVASIPSACAEPQPKE